MSGLRLTKWSIVAAVATALLSLAGAQTVDHPKPVHHKAQKAPHHTAPKATNHSQEGKVAHPETPKPAHHTTKKSRKKRPRGQQAIDGERTRQIQEALVRQHYMKAQPSGTWDSPPPACPGFSVMSAGSIGPVRDGAVSALPHRFGS